MLLAIVKKLPKNAKYTSPEIQNEIISVLTLLVEQKILNQIREAELFTLIVDGTTDKSYIEIVSILCRYIVEVQDGIEIVEHVACMVLSTDCSAKGQLGQVTSSLNDVGILLEGLASQGYDGASVMSGEQGGFQALLNIHCGRFVVYIHCFCHRLHLSVECIFYFKPVHLL